MFSLRQKNKDISKTLLKNHYVKCSNRFEPLSDLSSSETDIKVEDMISKQVNYFRNFILSFYIYFVGFIKQTETKVH